MMGTWYAFKCPGCGYSAEVSGGPDVGFDCLTVTISCATCRKLRDAIVSEDPWKKPPDPVREHPRCPGERTRKHRTKRWTAPGPCPRCGTEIGMHDTNGQILWD